MKVVSVIPESFQEFEDHISVVMFFFGCNFKCSYCYNYDVVTNIKNILPDSPETILDRCMSPLIDGCVLLGGEPTIYGNRLFELANYAKKEYNLDVKLFTNGSNPEIVIDGLMRGLFDRVSIDFKFFNSHDFIDFKCSGLTHENYVDSIINLLTRIRELNLQSFVEVRTTQEASVSDKEIEIIKNICNNFQIPHIIQVEVSDSYKRLGVL